MWRPHPGAIPELVWYAQVEPAVQVGKYRRWDYWIHPATKLTPDALLARLVNRVPGQRIDGPYFNKQERVTRVCEDCGERTLCYNEKPYRCESCDSIFHHEHEWCSLCQEYEPLESRDHHHVYWSDAAAMPAGPGTGEEGKSIAAPSLQRLGRYLGPRDTYILATALRCHQYRFFWRSNYFSISHDDPTRGNHPYQVNLGNRLHDATERYPEGLEMLDAVHWLYCLWAGNERQEYCKYIRQEPEVLQGLLTTPDLDIWTAEQLEIGALQPQRELEALKEHWQRRLAILQAEPEALRSQATNQKENLLRTMLKELNQTMPEPSNEPVF